MATILADITTTSNTRIAPAVAEFQSPIKAGFLASWVIMSGIAVNRSPSCSSSNRELRGPNDPKTPPTRIKGAAYPSALAKDNRVPVKIPGAAYGSTWCLMTSHFVAPTP